MPNVRRPKTSAEGRTAHATIELELTSYTGGGATQSVKENTEQPHWQQSPHQQEWEAEPTKPMCCCGGTNDLYVRLELLETKAAFETKPLPNAGAYFPIPDRLNNSGKFNLKLKGNSLQNSHLRVIIYDEEWGDDRLLGYYNKVPLEPISRGQKYLRCPTHQDGVFTGYVHIEFSQKDDSTLSFKVLGCREVNNMPPEAQCDSFKIAVGIFLIAYILIYAVVMGLVQNPEIDSEECEAWDSWTTKFDEQLWFVLVTFSSVGYGDFYPCTDSGRIVNGIFIILNQLTLAWFFTVATRLLIMQQTLLKVTVTGFATKFFEIHNDQEFSENQDVMTRDKDGDYRTGKIVEVLKKFDEVEGAIDYSYKVRWDNPDDGDEVVLRLQEEIKPNDPLTFERLNQELRTSLLWEGGVVAFFTIVGMIVFHELETGYIDDSAPAKGKVTWGQAFHFCIVTMSTVGYGDWAPSTRWGRAFGSFYILIGVSRLANFAGILVDYFMKERQLKASHDVLNNSLMSPGQLLQFDTNGDGSVDKYEYLVRMLLMCKFVEEDKIDLIMSKFYNLDGDKSGSISVEDFRIYSEKLSAKINSVE